VSVLGHVVTHLTERDVEFALIGAAAMAAHGVSRSTLDLDLLTIDLGVLQPAFWSTFATAVDLRRGDADDPLAGVVRVSAEGERDVDIVVGRAEWQGRLVSTARRMTVEDTSVPVVDAAGLILLKLFAGGSQDAWDIEQLLAAGDRAELGLAIERGVAELPPESRRLWARLRGRSIDEA
jgi:hypothetical protein